LRQKALDKTAKCRYNVWKGVFIFDQNPYRA